MYMFLMNVKVDVPGLDATDTIGSLTGPIIPPFAIAGYPPYASSISS
jgi:hypothetical protein